MAGTHVHEGCATFAQVDRGEGDAVAVVSDQVVGHDDIGGGTLVVRHLGFEGLNVGSLRRAVLADGASGAGVRPELLDPHSREDVVTKESFVVAVGVHYGNRKSGEAANLIINFGGLTGTGAGVYDQCPFQSENQSGIESVVIRRDAIHAVGKFNCASHRYNPTGIFERCCAIALSESKISLFGKGNWAHSERFSGSGAPAARPGSALVAVLSA